MGQTAVYGMGTIVPRVLNYFLLTPFYTRIFLPSEYGTITELYAYVAFLLVLLTYGMETAFFRFAQKDDNPEKVFSTALFSLFVTSASFIILILFLTQPIADALKYPDNKDYIIYFSMIVAMDAFTAIPFAYLRQKNKALRFSILKIINVLVNIGLNFFLLWYCPHVLKANPDSWISSFYSTGYGVGYAFIANLIASVITLILLIPDIYRLKPIIDFKLLRKMLSYAFPLLLVGVAGMINEVSDKIIFKYLVHIPAGLEYPEQYVMKQLGIYGAAYKLAVLMTLFIQMFRYAAEPFFFAQAKEDNAKQVYADVLKYFVIFGLFIFLGVMLFIGTVKYFIGPDFREGLFIVPIVLMANLLLGITYTLSFWYKLNDLTRYGAYIAIVGASLTILLNILLVPSMSYLGATWGRFTAYFVMVLLSYFWGQKFFPIKYELRRIGFYFLLAIGLFLISRYIDLTNTILRIGFHLVLLSIYVGTAYFLERKKVAA